MPLRAAILSRPFVEKEKICMANMRFMFWCIWCFHQTQPVSIKSWGERHQGAGEVCCHYVWQIQYSCWCWWSTSRYVCSQTETIRSYSSNSSISWATHQAYHIPGKLRMEPVNSLSSGDIPCWLGMGTGRWYVAHLLDITFTNCTELSTANQMRLQRMSRKMQML